MILFEHRPLVLTDIRFYHKTSQSEMLKELYKKLGLPSEGVQILKFLEILKSQFSALTAMESCPDDEKVARADDEASDILVRHLKR